MIFYRHSCHSAATRKKSPCICAPAKSTEKYFQSLNLQAIKPHKLSLNPFTVLNHLLQETYLVCKVTVFIRIFQT